jgi:hypothetical protein
MSKRHRYRKQSREPGGFIALPWSVLDSVAYQRLSHPAKALLLEVARQFHSDDNGRMLLSSRYLAPRGWRSPEVITRAKRELLDAGLIFETVRGARPNKASWYAVTWQSLDPQPGYDAGSQRAFVRGAYRLKDSIPKNTSLNTAAVVDKAPIATAAVVGKRPATTSDVAIRPVSGLPPTTPDVHPLDMPSPGCCCWGLCACLSRWETDGGASIPTAGAAWQ